MSRTCARAQRRTPAKYPRRSRRAGAFPHRASAWREWRQISPRSFPAARRRGARCTSPARKPPPPRRTRRSPPVSNSSGMSSTTTGAPRACASARRRRSASAPADARWLRASPMPRCRRARARASLRAIDLPSDVVPGKAASIGGDRFARVERDARLRRHHAPARPASAKKRAVRRLAHADRSGQAEDEHGARSSSRKTPAAGGESRAACKSGRPRMVK